MFQQSDSDKNMQFHRSTCHKYTVSPNSTADADPESPFTPEIWVTSSVEPYAEDIHRFLLPQHKWQIFRFTRPPPTHPISEWEEKKNVSLSLNLMVFVQRWTCPLQHWDFYHVAPEGNRVLNQAGRNSRQCCQPGECERNERKFR